jgi:hypothetical protein
MELLSPHLTPTETFFLENHSVFHHPQTNNPSITSQWYTNLSLLGESGWGGERGVYRVLVRKPEGKSPLGRPRIR